MMLRGNLRLQSKVTGLLVLGIVVIILSKPLQRRGSDTFPVSDAQIQKVGVIGRPISVNMFKALKTAEGKYKMLLKAMSKADIRKMEELTHRGLDLNWDHKFGFFPPGKPVIYPECLDLYSSETALKAKVSILIAFKDELTTVLLRAISSIAIRTPKHLLHEFVLVDDGSLQDYETEIKDYAAIFDVRLQWFRLNTTLGIANARHYGIQRTTGTVIVILDSHMVVSDMWLPPLLKILASKPRGIAVPLVQMVPDADYYTFNSRETIPYTWKLSRGYGKSSYSILQLNMTNPAHFYPSAAIGGGALAAQRDTLIELWPYQYYNGSWGVENLRLSLRAWACGEGLWLSICSQVVHPNGLDPLLDRYDVYNPLMKKNRRIAVAAEIANIMKDDGQISRLEDATILVNYRNEIKQTADRFAKTLNYAKCPHDYSWYLQNIHQSYHYQFFDDPVFEHVGIFQSASEPEQYIVNDFQNLPGQNDCVKTDSACNLVADYPKIEVSDRHLIGFSKEPLRVVTVADGYYGLICWDGFSPGQGAPIKYWACDNRPANSPPQQQFKYTLATQQIQHVKTNRCIEIITGRQLVEMNECDENKLQQRWIVHTPSWLRT